MKTDQPRYRVVPLPGLQAQLVDWMALAHRQHTVHGLLEVDVTRARQAIRAHRARSGEALSFTAFVIACFARAVDEDKRMQALRKGRRRLVLFDDVDVAFLVEGKSEAAKIPVARIVRAANRKSPAAITHEIRSAQGEAEPYAAARRWLPLWLLVPGFVRQFLLGRLLADPHRRKRLTGTVAVTSVGMFGRGVGYGIPAGTNYPLFLTIGAIGRKPSASDRSDGDGEDSRDGSLALREQLALTISFDHDVIDGGPAARFATRLKDLMEGAALLAEAPPGLPDHVPPVGASPRAGS